MSKTLEIIGHVYDNVNGRVIVTAPDEKERSIETYIHEAKLFPYLPDGEYKASATATNVHYREFVIYKKADKMAKVPKVKITITVEEIV